MDIPVPDDYDYDYDGDGKDDEAILRNGDVPSPAKYIPIISTTRKPPINVRPSA